VDTGHVSVQTSPSHSGRREKLINEIFLKKSLVAATHCSQTKQQIASTAQTKKKTLDSSSLPGQGHNKLITDTPLPNFAKERISHQPVTNITPIGGVFEYHNQVNNISHKTASLKILQYASVFSSTPNACLFRIHNINGPH
jgi:hypothetical protein